MKLAIHKKNPDSQELVTSCEPGSSYILRCHATALHRAMCKNAKELLRLTEDAVDLGSAHWADALCHAAS